MYSMDSGYGEIYWLQSFLVTKCETFPPTGPYALGNRCLKLGHMHLGTVPQTGAHSFGNMTQTGIINFVRGLLMA